MSAEAHTPLIAVFGISRCSSTVKDRAKLQSLSSRNQALARYGTSVHCSTHFCQCLPTELYYTINGVSSNSTGGMQSADVWAYRELFDQLNEFAASDSPGEIMLVVSTPDGFFTNSHHILSLFSPYSGTLNLTFVVYQPDLAAPRYFRMSEILDTLVKIQEKQPVDDEADVVLLAREWALVSLGKLAQSQGKYVVGSVARGRNVVDIETIDNTTSLTTSGKSVTTQDPGIRVYRYFRTGGTDQDPVFAPSEEKRQP